MRNKVIILGIRGIPARHGGFETFAEQLCLYLIKKSWDITVYCQEQGEGPVYESNWNGVERIHIPVKNEGPFGTIIFDWKSIIHSLRYKGVFLTLGYNTAIFNVLHRIFGKRNIINMDGIEWKRQKWGAIAKVWFWINERLGCWFGNHLVADHPEIEDHLATRISRKKITMITYGGKALSNVDDSVLDDFDLVKGKYGLVVARAEPENSILEIITAFSRRSRGTKLAVLGNYYPETNRYHKMILEVASDEVIFLGAIYDEKIVTALRFHARLYIHGYQVGGTNPSLVEALGAGNAILAHDNKYNRWVARDGAIYFNNVDDADQKISKLLKEDEVVDQLRKATRENFRQNFHWDRILDSYERLLLRFLN